MFDQPKENVAASSSRDGTCTTCGAKNVLVTHPPLPRCVDMKACDAQRAVNAAARAVARSEFARLFSRPVRRSYATIKDIEDRMLSQPKDSR